MLRQLAKVSRVVCPISIGFLLGALISVATQSPNACNNGLVDETSSRAVRIDRAVINNPNLDIVRRVAAAERPIEAVIKQPPPQSKLNANRKPSRPRYLATETNQRDKLYVLVLTSSQKFDSAAKAINRTVSHHVSKAAFVIDADGNDVGNTYGTRMNVLRAGRSEQPAARLLHLLEYLQKHGTVDNYDWVFIMTDTTYLKAFKLHELVSHTSLGNLLLLGRPAPPPFRQHCQLGAGMLLSHELLNIIFRKLPACLATVDNNAPPEVNLAECIERAANVTCRSEWNGKVFRAWESPSAQDLDSRLVAAANGVQYADQFSSALTVWPVHNEEQQFLLNAHYCQQEIDALTGISSMLQQELMQLRPPVAARHWPVEVRPPSVPKTRYEAHKWQTFTNDTLYANRPDVNRLTLSGSDKLDIDDVVLRARQFVREKHSIDDGDALSLVTGYRLFDAARGMEYVVDLRDANHRLHRVRALRPLTRAEAVNEVPYVREDANVTIVVPLTNDDVSHVSAFMQRYVTLICGQAEVPSGVPSTSVAFTLYGAHQSSSYAKVLRMIQSSGAERCTRATHNFNVYDMSGETDVNTPRDVLLALVQQRQPVGLCIVVDVWTQMTNDFLNRVRLNVVPGYQVFTPIAFYEFDKRIINEQHSALLAVGGALAHNTGDNSDLFGGHDYLMPVNRDAAGLPDEANVKIDVHKDHGRFDLHDRTMIAVAVADLLSAIHNGALRLNDPTIDSDDLISVLFAMPHLHIMRAPDPHLIVHFHDRQCNVDAHSDEYRRCMQRRKLAVANKAQLSKLLIEQQYK